MRLSRRAAGAALVVLAAAALAVPLPFYVIRPGSALPVEERVMLGRPADRVSGDLLLLTVSLGPATAVEALVAWLDGEQDVLPRDDVIPEGVDEGDYVEAQRRLFRESGQVAAAVGLRAAGLEVRVTGGGARVVGVVPGAPAEEELREGDVVTAIGGRPVELASDLAAAVSSLSAGDEVTLSVERGDATIEARIELEQIEELGRPALGVALQTVDLDIALPVAVDIEQGRIGGPSAGLMIALTVYDLAHPADLTRSRTIAGTGTISLNGEVGPVGGVAQKVATARAAGAQLMLVPPEEAAEAREEAGPRLEVVPVRTIQEAISRLVAPP
ncbi:MAG: PDZ domain-containing protein [Actinomycetota bacterium]|nr:PDZ domain-containing protein [Actinomycetota bacterium]